MNEPKLSLRQRRHRETEEALWRALERRDDLLDKLARAHRNVTALQKAKGRLERALAHEFAPPLNVSPVSVSVAQGELLPPVEPVVAPAFDDGIPDLLRRTAEKDAQALKEIAADKEARAKAKREAKTAVPPARKLGPDARKMPLTGKAALDAIRGR